MFEEENLRLTDVTADSAAGQMLRRYWWPIAIAQDLKDRPTLVRLLGEDLVLFRTGDGRLGLLGSMCAHRCANLSLGIVDNDGLRCRYHGWKYGRDGALLDVPHSGQTSVIAGRIKQPAYTAVEQAGVILAYLGPQPVPLVPQYDFLVDDGERIPEINGFSPVNWLQCVENGMDPNHVAFLHGDLLADLNEKPEEIGFIGTQFGLAHCTKRALPNSGGTLYREHHVVMPGISVTGAAQRRVKGGSGPGAVSARWTVPIDNENSMMVNIFFKSAANTGSVAAVNFGAFGTWEAVRLEPYHEYKHGLKGSLGYTMPKTVPAQDATIVESMGSICPRERENLVPGDEAIVRLRRLYMQAIEAVENGADPLGVFRQPASVRVDAHEKLSPETGAAQPAEV